MSTIRYNWKPVVNSLFYALKKSGIKVEAVNNGDEWETTDLLNHAVACDEAWLRVRPPGETKAHTVYIVLGNEPFELVADWTTHPDLDIILDRWSNSWEGRKCPTVKA